MKSIGSSELLDPNKEYRFWHPKSPACDIKCIQPVQIRQKQPKEFPTQLLVKLEVPSANK